MFWSDKSFEALATGKEEKQAGGLALAVGPGWPLVKRVRLKIETESYMVIFWLFAPCLPWASVSFGFLWDTSGYVSRCVRVRRYPTPGDDVNCASLDACACTSQDPNSHGSADIIFLTFEKIICMVKVGPSTNSCQFWDVYSTLAISNNILYITLYFCI